MRRRLFRKCLQCVLLYCNRSTFVTSRYTHDLASSSLNGCNFLIAAVLTPANSMGHSLLLLWGPEARGDFTRWCQIGQRLGVNVSSAQGPTDLGKYLMLSPSGETIFV